MTALPLRDFTAAEQAKLAAIEAAPAAEEAFDATAALRRVLEACADLDDLAAQSDGWFPIAANTIRAAVEGDR